MSYTAKDIETLSFRDAIRTRVEMYLGSADNQGILQCVREIITNSIDEAMMGYGKKIIVSLNNDSNLNPIIEVTDYGRGCPFGIREDGTEALEAIYMMPHSGGKFSDKIYQGVAGLNGIGAKGVALSSSVFIVSSVRDGKKATLDIRDGFKASLNILSADPKDHGTTVSFTPSPEVFHLEKIEIDVEEIKEMCNTWSYLNPGLEFEIYDNRGEEQQYWKYSTNRGIIELVENKSNSIIGEVISGEITDGLTVMSLAMAWTKGREQSFIFTNGLMNIEGGTPLTGLKMAITRFIKKQFGEEFDGDTCRTGLVYAISTKMRNPSFANQTKTKITNPELNGIAQKLTTDTLNNFFLRNAKDSKAIIDFLGKERKASIAAEKARAAILDNQKVIQKESKKAAVLAGCLNDCRDHGPKSQLIIVEGKSAGGSLLNARDSQYTAIIPLRGKPINVLKNSIEDALQNEEVQSLMKALGCGYGSCFNIRKLRYGRIVICADADYDGYSIMCLLLVFFYHFYPELVSGGYIYWGRAPLYKVSSGKKVYYAYTDEELAKMPKGDISRMKGLGEATPDDFNKTLFSKDGRYTQFTMKDVENAEYFFEMLLGKEVSGRRDYIFDNVDFEEIEE